jgi:hypothetical protein
MSVPGSSVRRLAAVGAAGLLASLALAAAGAAPASAAPAAAPAAAASGAVHNPLLRELLAEEEEGAEESPTLNALCQDFLGHPNPYPNPAPNVDQITGDPVVATGSQTGCNSAQNETSIAVNPANPRNIVAGANDYRVFNSREQRNDSSGVAYTSFDGGRTWTNVVLPKLTFQTGGVGAFSYFDAAGDPVISFGPNNTVYYGNIVFSRAVVEGQQASGIVVNVSHDGGLHWSDPVVIQIDGVTPAGVPFTTHVFNDKIWMAADPSSGRVYVTWTKFTYDQDDEYIESPIVVSASRDFGRTWSAPGLVTPPLADFHGGITPFAQGSNPQVGRDGTLYVAYETSICATLDCDRAGDRDATLVATSTDRGRTFRQSIVDTNFDFPVDENTGSMGLTGENFRINSYPQLAYDRKADRLWVTWADDRNGRYDDATGESVRTNGDNIVATSRDGRHWSHPDVVGTAQDEVFGAVAAYDGRVAVTSYTRHYDPHGIDLDYAYWQAGRQGFRGADIRRITTVSQNPQVQFVGNGLEDGEVLQGLFIGDYTAVAIGTDLRIHPCWTDFRGRPGTNTPNQDAYTQSISLR